MFAIRLTHIIILFTLIISFSFGVLITVLNNQVIDFSVLEHNTRKPSVLLDDEGKVWTSFEIDKRGYTKFEHLPKHLINAFLAAEDRNFFNHAGLSYKGILRSLIVNLWHRKKVQGASTITQQLVRLLFFDANKTFKRKVKEQIFALLVEMQFSKEQILELYLNHIYLGCGIYGVEAGAQRFFGKSVQEISIAQAAVLAAIIKSPATYCPLLNLDAAKKRRDLILNLMQEQGFITKQQLIDEKSSKLELINNKNESIAPHLKETIRIFLEEKIGKQKLYNSGLTIQTTINSKIQLIAQEEFKKQFTILKKELYKESDGALICMDSQTGQIKALIGGYDFVFSKFNRALQAKRQMGSIFKPIIYAAAMQKGMSFADTEIDEPIEIEFGGLKWTPNNNTRKFEGKMTLARALSYSNNTISVKTLMKVGCKEVVDLAKKFRFSAQLNPYPSLALGCIDITLKESVGSFNVFANNGVYVEPHFIKWVKDSMGIKIFKFEPEQENILTPAVAGQVAKVLTVNIKRYLDRIENKTFTYEAIGKTGTTNNSRTCWFSGACSNLTTSIYIGSDDNKSLGENIYAIKTIFPIWAAIHERLNLPESPINYDPNLKEIYIDWMTGEQYPGMINSNIVPILITQ
jgi:penicillin-binding protein 1A